MACISQRGWAGLSDAVTPGPRQRDLEKHLKWVGHKNSAPDHCPENGCTWPKASVEAAVDNTFRQGNLEVPVHGNLTLR